MAYMLTCTWTYYAIMRLPLALVAPRCGPRRQARQLAHQVGRRDVEALLDRLEELERLGCCGWRLHSRQFGAVEAEEAALADERPGRGRARRFQRRRGCRRVPTSTSRLPATPRAT